VGSRLRKRGAISGSRIKVNDSASSPGENPDSLPPIFCLRYLSKEYCLSACEKNEKSLFADAIHRLSQLSWRQLRHAPKDGVGYEKISQTAITGGSIPDVVTPEVRLISFRCFGKAPMVGFKSGRIFHILWLDRKFTLYDHGS